LDQSPRIGGEELGRVKQLECYTGRQRLVTVADHRCDTGHVGYLIGRALRIAASDDDFRGRILPVDATDESACRPIGFGRHAAGIDDDEIGGVESGFGKAAGAEMAANGFAVGASRPATEILDVKAGHRIPVYGNKQSG
jgi:hypothetical protein